MDKGIYTALSGGIAKAHELELISNNLANSTTPGFKKDIGTFNEYLMEFRNPDSVEGLKREIDSQTLNEGRVVGDKSFVEMDGVYTSFEQGPVTKTGRNLDFSLHGKGFFEVLTPSGIRYTRQGNFNVSSSGILVTVNGYPVLSRSSGRKEEFRSLSMTEEGKILSDKRNTISNPSKGEAPEARIISLEAGPFYVTEEGDIYQGGRKVSSLSVEEFKENQLLEKIGNSYFKNTNAENIKSLDKPITQVHQGFLESSNVNPVREMTKLIEVTRAYESHMQAIKTYQEIDAKSVNDIVRER